MGIHYTDWMDLEGDNALIVSSPFGPLQALNPFPFDSWDSWMNKVIRRFSTIGPARPAHWAATEALGGDDVHTAGPCCWEHAQHGDTGEQLWNGGGGADDTSPAICRALESTPAENIANLGAAYNYIPDTEFTRTWQADIVHSARALFWLPVRDNLGPGGVLFPPSATDLGLPSDAELEWEGGDTADPDLLGVEFTTDNFGTRYTTGALDDNTSIAVALHTAIRPGGYTVDASDDTTGEYAQWPIGQVDDTPGTGETLLLDHWTGGDPTWVEIPDQVAGVTGWDNANDYSSEGPGPDEMAVLAAWVPFANLSPVDGGGGNELCDIALRFTLQARRFRYSYVGADYAQAPRRVIGRKSPARVYPIDRTQGNGPRVIGGYL